MAKIWNDIDITWLGESYSIRPTIAFINMLEQGDGMSLSKMLGRALQQDLPVGLACELIARTLRHAGVSVNAENVYMEAGGLSADLIIMATSILIGCMPSDKDADTKKKPKLAKSVKSTGAKSTE
jgi:hypothetical protein